MQNFKIICLLFLMVHVANAQETLGEMITQQSKIHTLNQYHLPIKSQNKWGLVNNMSAVTIQNLDYDSLGFEVFDKQFIVVKNGKYGIVKFNDKYTQYQEIVPCKNDSIYALSQFWIFKNAQLEIAFHKNPSKKIGGIESLSWINNKLVKVKKGAQYGILDSNLNTPIPIDYEVLIPLDNNYYIAGKSGKVGLINLQNKVLIPLDYDALNKDQSNLYRVWKKQKWFYYHHAQGEFEMIPSNGAQFVELVHKKYYRKKIKDQSFALYQFQKHQIVHPKNWKDVGFLSEQYLYFKENNAIGLCDSNLNVLIPAQYEEIQFLKDQYFAYKKNGKYGLIDAKNNKISEALFDRMWALKNPDNLFFGVQQKGLVSCIDQHGELLTPFKYRKLCFHNGVFFVPIVGTYLPLIKEAKQLPFFDEIMKQGGHTVVVSGRDSLYFMNREKVFYKGLKKQIKYTSIDSILKIRDGKKLHFFAFKRDNKIKYQYTYDEVSSITFNTSHHHYTTKLKSNYYAKGNRELHFNQLSGHYGILNYLSNKYIVPDVYEKTYPTNLGHLMYQHQIPQNHFNIDALNFKSEFRVDLVNNSGYLQKNLTAFNFKTKNNIQRFDRNPYHFNSASLINNQQKFVPIAKLLENKSYLSDFDFIALEQYEKTDLFIQGKIELKKGEGYSCKEFYHQYNQHHAWIPGDFESYKILSNEAINIQYNLFNQANYFYVNPAPTLYKFKDAQVIYKNGRLGNIPEEILEKSHNSTDRTIYKFNCQKALHSFFPTKRKSPRYKIFPVVYNDFFVIENNAYHHAFENIKALDNGNFIVEVVKDNNFYHNHYFNICSPKGKKLLAKDLKGSIDYLNGFYILNNKRKHNALLLNSNLDTIMNLANGKLAFHNENLILFEKQRGLNAVYNFKGERLIAPKYKVHKNSNEFYLILHNKYQSVVLDDIGQELYKAFKHVHQVISPTYLLYKKSKRYVLYDYYHDEKIRTKRITSVKGVIDTSAFFAVVNKRRKVIYKTDGSLLKFDDYDELKSNFDAHGFAIAKKDNDKFLIHKQKGEILEMPSYHYDVLNNMIRIWGKFGEPFYYDLEGKPIPGLKGQKVNIVAPNKRVVIEKLHNKYALCNIKGHELSDRYYDQILPFVNDTAVVVKDGKYGAIDLNGKLIVPLRYKYLEINPHGPNIIKPFYLASLMNPNSRMIGSPSDDYNCIKIDWVSEDIFRFKHPDHSFSYREISNLGSGKNRLIWRETD